MSERFLDVSHEALIRGWPRLRRWLDEDRAGLRLQHRITEAAQEWQHSSRDNDLLYRGARLMQAQEWRARYETELNPLEREFLDASIALKQRVEEEKRLHEAESERVKLLLEKRKRERMFSVTVFFLGVVLLIAIGLFINQMRKERKADKERLQSLVETGKDFRENAKSILASGIDNPTKDVAALRNLALALNSNPRDTEAAKLASNLLLQNVWCPPAAPAVVYQKDALLAATFVPGGSNNEIFAVGGDGLLSFWNGGRSLSPTRSLFEKPKPVNPQQIVQSGFASFSPNGNWLLIIPPTLVSAVRPDAAAQGPPQEGARPGHELCKIQIWRWSTQNRTYEPTGEDLEIQRLIGSRINFTWSDESDQFVLINARGTNEVECAFFEVEGTFRELVDRSTRLTAMKIVALAFAAYHSGMTAVFVDSKAPAQRKVALFKFWGEYLEVIPINDEESILLPEDFQPNGIAFGPGDGEISLTSWNSVRILNIGDGTVTPIPPPTFRDQFMRLVVGPGEFATRLVATSLYGRIHVAKGAHREEPAEPVLFRGSIGIPQFSLDGQRLLILSGGMFNVFDSMRLIDVSALYRPQTTAPEKLEETSAPPWLAEIACAASACDPNGDGSLVTLEDVRKKYPKSKAGDAYEAVWKRFFPDEKSNGILKTSH